MPGTMTAPLLDDVAALAPLPHPRRRPRRLHPPRYRTCSASARATSPPPPCAARRRDSWPPSRRATTRCTPDVRGKSPSLRHALARPPQPRCTPTSRRREPASRSPPSGMAAVSIALQSLVRANDRGPASTPPPGPTPPTPPCSARRTSRRASRSTSQPVRQLRTSISTASTPCSQGTRALRPQLPQQPHRLDCHRATNWPIHPRPLTRHHGTWLLSDEGLLPPRLRRHAPPHPQPAGRRGPPSDRVHHRATASARPGR